MSNSDKPMSAANSEYEITVDGYDMGICLGHYHYTAPSGKCAQLCETPEEFYGDTDLEYQIVWIWGEGDCATTGDDLDLPEGIDRGAVDEAVIRAINGAYG